MKIYAKSQRENHKTLKGILTKYGEKDVWIKFKDYRDHYCYIKFDEPSYYAYDNGAATFYYQRIMVTELDEHAGKKMIFEDRTKSWEFSEDYRLCLPIDTLTTEEVMEMLQR